MKKILFIAAHRKGRSPSQRFRFEQYFKFFEANGLSCHLSFIISERDDRILYKRGNYFSKGIIFLKSFVKRLNDVIRARGFDIIFIQREAFMTGTILFEKLLKQSGKPIIFDFDDSIWLQDKSPINNSLQWLKNPSKTAEIIKLSNIVVAGNNYLAAYARKYNENVVVIPTTINTNTYCLVKEHKSDKVCIGWSGSFSTIKHFELAIPALRKIKMKYGDSIYFKVIGDTDYRCEELEIEGVKWTEETEIQELSELHIGIMPLPNDDWSMGKCGLKGLQYMALSIPTIMSPVGVNSEIIEDGENGFLALSEEDWVKKLSQLIESKQLRNAMGVRGRESVEKLYSVESQKENYLRVIQSLL